jgi:3-oxoacyl-[acyl-carrier-protein] synthase-3
MACIIREIEYLFPNKLISNESLSLEFPNYDFSKFEKKVGIRNRYIVSENETALTLAIRVVNKLFDKSNVKRSEIDFVLYCTQSPEYFLPTSACLIQNECGLRTDVGALDFNLGCSGYTYGLNLAKKLINGSSIKNVLLVTSETYSKYINDLDRMNRSIFGDAATVSLISFSQDEGVGEFLFGTDGAGASDLIVKNGASFCSIDPNPEMKIYGTDNQYTDNNLFMNGPAVFNFTSTIIPDFTQKVLSINNTIIDEIQQFVFHQANAFMLTTLRKQLQISESKFYVDLLDGGNTVSNTIPIAIKRFLESGKANLGDRIVLIGFGVGFSWCGGLITLKKLF